MPRPASRRQPTRVRVVLHVLRLLVAALGALLLAVGVLGPISIGAPIWTGIYFIVLGVGAIAISFFERLRYVTAGDGAGTGLRPTQERFVDPTTGQRLQVWIDPASGERSYVPDGDSPQK